MAPDFVTFGRGVPTLAGSPRVGTGPTRGRPHVGSRSQRGDPSAQSTALGTRTGLPPAADGLTFGRRGGTLGGPDVRRPHVGHRPTVRTSAHRDAPTCGRPHVGTAPTLGPGRTLGRSQRLVRLSKHLDAPSQRWLPESARWAPFRTCGRDKLRFWRHTGGRDGPHARTAARQEGGGGGRAAGRGRAGAARSLPEPDDARWMCTEANEIRVPPALVAITHPPSHHMARTEVNGDGVALCCFFCLIFSPAAPVITGGCSPARPLPLLPQCH